MKSILPMILVVLLLVGAIFYSLTKKNLTQLIPKQFGVPATELEIVPVTPTPTEPIRSLGEGRPTATPTPTLSLVKGRNGEAERDLTPTPSVIPTLTTKGGEPSPRTTSLALTTKNSPICTPVYGMANNCTEHVVVDTAGESDLFYSFAGLSYLAGLAAFVKSKYA